MLVVRLFLVVILDQRVDFLGHHAFVADVVQRTRHRRHAFLDQDGIDREIAGDIPAVLDAMLTPRKVRQRTMHRLVSKRELGLLQREAVDVFRVVI